MNLFLEIHKYQIIVIIIQHFNNHIYQNIQKNYLINSYKINISYYY